VTALQGTRLPGVRVRRGLAVWSAGAAYLASAAACCVLAARSKANFVDLHVYRMGGAAVLHGGHLYQLRFAWLPFTYPPFAAVVFTTLAAIPWGVAAALLTGASAVTLPVTLHLALRLPRPRRAPAAWPLALAAAAAVIWLEPIRTTLAYGQVDILLADRAARAGDGGRIPAARITGPRRSGSQPASPRRLVRGARAQTR